MVPIAWKGDQRFGYVVIAILVLIALFACTMCGPNLEFKPGGMFRKDRYEGKDRYEP